jgi:hypothetical protein
LHFQAELYSRRRRRNRIGGADLREAIVLVEEAALGEPRDEVGEAL